VCRVGIPETLVRVVDTGRYDPPLDVGWLPRPHTLLIVVPADRTWADEDDEGDTIELESAAPLVIELAGQARHVQSAAPPSLSPSPSGPSGRSAEV
jgi:hypothetical protein